MLVDIVGVVYAMVVFIRTGDYYATGGNGIYMLLADKGHVSRKIYVYLALGVNVGIVMVYPRAYNGFYIFQIKIKFRYRWHTLIALSYNIQSITALPGDYTMFFGEKSIEIYSLTC